MLVLLNLIPSYGMLISCPFSRKEPNYAIVFDDFSFFFLFFLFNVICFGVLFKVGCFI